MLVLVHQVGSVRSRLPEEVRFERQREQLTRKLYGSCQELDVGPQPLTRYELEQGSKVLSTRKQNRSWIKQFDRGPVEAAYRDRFSLHQLQFPERFAGEPILCNGARFGGEVRAFTSLGALAIGIDLNPGFRNQHVLWGDALAPQFAPATFRFVYSNVLDHVADPRRFLSEAHRLLKPSGVLLVDLDYHAPDAWAHGARANTRAVSRDGRLAAATALSARWSRLIERNGFELIRSRPFCTTDAALQAARESGKCVRGNPTIDGGVDPQGGVSYVARKRQPAAAE